jgi:hypothetical protein
MQQTMALTCWERFDLVASVRSLERRSAMAIDRKNARERWKISLQQFKEIKKDQDDLHDPIVWGRMV